MFAVHLGCVQLPEERRPCGWGLLPAVALENYGQQESRQQPLAIEKKPYFQLIVRYISPFAQVSEEAASCLLANYSDAQQPSKSLKRGDKSIKSNITMKITL